MIDHLRNVWYLNQSFMQWARSRVTSRMHWLFQHNLMTLLKWRPSCCNTFQKYITIFFFYQDTDTCVMNIIHHIVPDLFDCYLRFVWCNLHQHVLFWCWFQFEKTICLSGKLIYMLYATMSSDSAAIMKYNNSNYTVAVRGQPIQDQLRKNENRLCNCTLFVCNWVQKMYW